MKSRKVIFKILSLLMLVCVFTTQYSVLINSDTYTTVNNDQDDEGQTVIKQLSQETVIPHYDFSFGDISAFFKNLSAFLYPIEEKNTQFWDTQPNISFLAKLLEHHIAINAP